MSEDFLHFIWKFGLFDRQSLIADTGETVEVISLGEHNPNAGPDFLDARVRIDSTTWAGNVEIHLRSSDWQQHSHMTDKSYDSVILHVVYHHNMPLYRSTGTRIPTIELRFDMRLFETFACLESARTPIPCSHSLLQLERVTIAGWIESLAIERLQEKTDRVNHLLQMSQGNWEEVFYVLLARGFGFGLNADPFERVARSVPLPIVRRHRSDLSLLEALYLGQAGFLQKEATGDDYLAKLNAHYQHLRNLHHLSAIEKHQWKFLRLRPRNFPTLRLAQFASLMHRHDSLFSFALGASRINDMKNFFGLQASEYWHVHLKPGKQAADHSTGLGTEAFHSLMINSVIPVLFLYGSLTGKENVCEKAVDWLSRIPAEKNRITMHWQQAGVGAQSAMDSQGMLRLMQHYCMKRKCLSCAIGTYLIRHTQKIKC